MLSWPVRKRLLLILFSLLLIYALIPSGNSVPADAELTGQVNLLLQEKEYSQAVELIQNSVGQHETRLSKSLEKKLDYATKMQESSTSFQKGMDAYEEGDYTSAYGFFKQVIPEDVDHFTTAREKICELNQSLVKYTKGGQP